VVTRGSRMKHPRWGAGDVHKMRIFYPQALSRVQNKPVVVVVYCYLRIHICTKITTAKVRADAILCLCLGRRVSCDSSWCIC